MCNCYCNCDYCIHNWEKCECFAERIAICHKFICVIPFCTGNDCIKDCISAEELKEFEEVLND